MDKEIIDAITNFLEEDCHSRLCPGRKDSVTRKNERKQKRLLLDSRARKGAPDGIGGTCKKTAAKLFATGKDIPSIEAFALAVEENCPGIKTFIIKDGDIDDKQTIIDFYKARLRPFVGTLKVHKVQGNSLSPHTLIMKSLSCFCSDTCSHYRLGRINYPFDYPKHGKLSVDDIYSDSDSEAAGCSNEKINEDSNDSVYKNGDCVLVNFEQKITNFVMLRCAQRSTKMKRKYS
ncbi:hypothetical protein HHI36_012343 [Cryptolaemus montrouzieri]|uniref:Uncharacterized protein n=1 Tax=Cryptolaemus montrouzieri TaxID=559131 RepID=A0ABD2NE01_9CUCU